MINHKLTQDTNVIDRDYKVFMDSQAWSYF